MQYIALGSSEPVLFIFGRPLLHGVQDCPPSVVRKTPTALIPTQMRFLFCGSIRIVCRQSPPLPGNHLPFFRYSVSEVSSFQVEPLSWLTKIPASSMPAYIVPFCDGCPSTSCQIRLSLNPVSFGY